MRCVPMLYIMVWCSMCVCVCMRCFVYGVLVGACCNVSCDVIMCGIVYVCGGVYVVCVLRCHAVCCVVLWCVVT